MGRVDKIQDRVRKATRGKWTWWTSCSWRRLMTEHEVYGAAPVLVPTVSRADGHPDCSVTQDDMALIENAPADLRYLLRLVGEYENGLTASGCGDLIDPARQRAQQERSP